MAVDQTAIEDGIAGERRLGLLDAHRLSRPLPWVPAPHLDAAFKAAEDLLVGDRQAVQGLLISMPPRWGKTTFAMQLLSWWLRRKSSARALLLCGHAALAHRAEAQARGRGNTRLKAVGPHEPVCGEGFDLIVADDPNGYAVPGSRALDATMDWFDSAILTHANPGAPLVLVCSRIAKRDVYGRLAERGGVEAVNVCAEVFREDTRRFGSRWRERWDDAAIDALRDRLPRRVWDALYQGAPGE